MFTIAVVNDSPVARTGIARVAADGPALAVAAEVASVHELEQLDVVCDIVVLDVPAPGDEPTIDLIARLAKASRLVVTSSWQRPPTVLAVVRAGANACLTHYSARQAVTDALRTVACGGLYICPLLAPRFQAELRQPPAPNAGLAPREVETLRGIALGFTHAQIASRMGLSLATVNTYAKRLRTKLHVSNKAELTRKAIEMGQLAVARQDHDTA